MHIHVMLQSTIYFIFSWWKACRLLMKVKVAQLCTTLCDPTCNRIHGILHARILEWVAFPFFRASSQPRDWTQVSHMAGRFFTSWAIGKPKNTRVGSLSLLQWIFLTQDSNQGLLHWRQILYQLNFWKPRLLLMFCYLKQQHYDNFIQILFHACVFLWRIYP